MDVEVKWTRMEDGTEEEFRHLMELEAAFNRDLVDRVLAHLRLLDVDWGGYRINRYRHCLQSATRAHRDGADEEMVVAALLHDIGDIIAPYNHGELAAALLKPYVSDRVHWIVAHHGIFQGYYYNHHLGGDRHARDRYKGHPWYDDCAYFCHAYDQNAFDPDYDTEPLEFFEPMVRRLFAGAGGHLELAGAAERPGT
ncbi:MAG: HD domain-containing protein [Hyphomicrobiales bacterium]|nr:HD domain-containing protein [Hyphomicrobiales bacterium]MCP5371652.1 HD domain-containing protein [Hyphomicrobiales bacterium]